MKTKPERFHLIYAFAGIFCGWSYIATGEYGFAIWPLSAAAVGIRCYQLEAWHFEIEDEDDDGDEWKREGEPQPTAPANDADWWKGGGK